MAALGGLVRLPVAYNTRSGALRSPGVAIPNRFFVRNVNSGRGGSDIFLFILGWAHPGEFPESGIESRF